MKLILATLISVATTAHAHLIDLTPGGFQVENGIPPAFNEMQRQTFFDEAAHGVFNDGQLLDGWVSLYGSLNGGTYFFTDLFGRDTPTASVSWNIAGAPYGLWMSIIMTTSVASGEVWYNIYRVSQDQLFEGSGIVTVNGRDNISSIAYFGTNHIVADNGTSILLFALGLLAIVLLAFALQNQHLFHARSVL
jgi:hypothetical protein